MAFTDTAREVYYERADASLLAKTPAIIPWKTWTSNQDWEDFRNYLETDLIAKRSWRTPWWMHWGEIAAQMLPRRYFWVITPNNMTRGLPINQNVVDSTPTQAINICAAGLMDGLSNEEKIWFKFGPSFPNVEFQQGFDYLDAAGKNWINEFQTRTYEVLDGSNYYDSKYQYYEDQVTFGTAPMLIYEDRERIVEFQNPCAGEYFASVGKSNEVISFTREFVMTVRAMMQRFGPKALAGTDISQLWNTKSGNLETEAIVAHTIEPNFSAAQYGQPSKLGVVPGGYPYRETYWLRGKSTPQPLSVRGFHEKPLMYARWTERNNDPYGRGPGMDALPDVSQLNQLQRRLAEAVDKGIRPSIMADASMKNEPASTLPNKVTYVPNLAQSGGMKAIFVPDAQFVEMGYKIVEALQQRIERWFYNDVFQTFEQMEGVQPRNELEIAERKGEKLLRLGSVIGRNLRQDAICLQRVVSIMARRGIVPPKPPSLRNVPIQVKFVSKLALVAEAAKTAGMERTIVMGGRMEAIRPGTLDEINFPRYLRTYGEALQFPPEDWNTEAEKKQLADARAKSQQAAAAAHAAQNIAPAVTDAAQNLSETNVGGGVSALQMMLGQQGQNPGGAG